MQLDKHDHTILSILQKDGRIPVTALAERVGLSPNATAERMRRMQRDGVITGFRATLSPVAMGRGLTAFVEVRLDRTSSDVFDAFAHVVRDLEGVEECHMVAGGFDYLLKTRHRDMAAYRAFLSDRLVDLPGVRETRTYAVMEAVIEGGALTVG
ncbi:Lrp/AsnC family transcriptional regulator, leucine-responsive regulatory protein [Jannaschia faecimaris]|uniref:Lrp/AsnC family transcriptional regulator, leucine-responsive regulatory protein n=1 Tax=Jannaschia faecimaris TaxID=1244108 RepID=A0A1H3JVE4_9RHOB|nr:Lrp/AsnC ligand binding domain-containing protein [Jannaschia faecimaris]SDY43841.1 Lrp/AsnC family transcriptional regulator, leucine-responsive regulatory protein [Jannaschia faecimaris]